MNKKQKYKNKYYVYLHIDPRTSQVFYAGKGTEGRAWVISSRSKEHLSWINSLKSLNLLPLIKVIHVFDNEKDSLEREKMIISFLLRTGHPLFNKNKGGGGHPGGATHPMYGKPKSAEVRRKLSLANTGKIRSDVSELNKIRMISNNIKKGTKSRQETKNKISKSLIGNQRSSVKVFCENNGKTYNSVKEAWTDLGLDERSVFRVLKGEYRHTKGYRFKYI